MSKASEEYLENPNLADDGQEDGLYYHHDTVIKMLDDFALSILPTDEEVWEQSIKTENYDLNDSSENQMVSVGRYHGFRKGTKWYKQQIENKCSILNK